MEWPEALEKVVAATGHEPYRRLCADDHPDRELWRARMIARATGEPSPPGGLTWTTSPAPAPAGDPVAYPSPARMAANLARDLFDWACSGFSTTSEAERARRIAICEGCEHFDPAPRRCKHLGCGCFLEEKVKLRTAHCPLDPPRW